MHLACGWCPDGRTSNGVLLFRGADTCCSLKAESFSPGHPGQPLLSPGSHFVFPVIVDVALSRCAGPSCPGQARAALRGPLRPLRSGPSQGSCHTALRINSLFSEMDMAVVSLHRGLGRRSHCTEDVKPLCRLGKCCTCTFLFFVFCFFPFKAWGWHR